ncbi:MAG: hypothetical protein ABI417_21755 [Coleofasciculaceae cyanobacterium]
MTELEPPRSESSPEAAPENVFNAVVIEVLGKDNFQAYSIILFIQRCLIQFNLTTQYETHEIFNDAYLRGREFMQSGGIIRNPHSWLKSTSLNIIREASRRQKREPLIDPEIVELMPCFRTIEDSIVCEEDINNKWKSLINSLVALSHTDPEGARLLCLKAKGLSWKQIHQQLIREDGQAKSESSLRQKGCRATKTLRKIYNLETSNTAERANALIKAESLI